MQKCKTNVIEQILKKELNLSDGMYNRFMAFAGTQTLKKKEMFVEQYKVCHQFGIIESGVLRHILKGRVKNLLKISIFPVQ